MLSALLLNVWYIRMAPASVESKAEILYRVKSFTALHSPRLFAYERPVIAAVAMAVPYMVPVATDADTRLCTSLVSRSIVLTRFIWQSVLCHIPVDAAGLPSLQRRRLPLTDSTLDGLPGMSLRRCS